MKIIYKLLITIIITLICLILIKKSNAFKDTFYKKVYEDSFDFGYVNTLYQRYLGSILPLNIDKTKEVFSEELIIDSYNDYLNGVKIETKNKLVPSMNSGLVYFVGDKEEYGKTVIISGDNGIDIWYSNLDNINVKLYDYIDKGSLIGESNNLVLVFKRDGEVLDYHDYIN